MVIRPSSDKPGEEGVRDKVVKVINLIRPAVQSDGGDLELVDIDGDNVQIAFRKACAGCASSGNTARFVEMKLRELVYDGLRVQEVPA